jgi:hypothetical protein
MCVFVCAKGVYVWVYICVYVCIYVCSIVYRANMQSVRSVVKYKFTKTVFGARY